MKFLNVFKLKWNNVFFFFLIFHLVSYPKLSHIQNEIESTMDEIKNNGTIIISDTEKTAAETRGFISKEIFNTANTGNSGKW